MKTLHYTKIAVVAHWVFLKVCAHNITIDWSASLKVGEDWSTFSLLYSPTQPPTPLLRPPRLFSIRLLPCFLLHPINENFLQNTIYVLFSSKYYEIA